MKNQITGPAQARRAPTCLALAALLAVTAQLSAADPRLDSWFTKYSAQYARLYETSSDQSSGKAKTTWSRGSVNQSLPAYSGVQEVFSSPDWVYVHTTGLGSHVMGPWYLGVARTQIFPNLPGNTKTLYRLPRHPNVPSSKTLTGLGVIGYFVDGVAMFDGRDGFFWNGTSETGGQGSGVWNRDAYVNESATFDPAFAHQEQTGTYHYHANPPALRYLLGDNVTYDAATKIYGENTTNPNPTHSPILGWVRDGYPIYGPYGYSKAIDAHSGVRSMASGFVRRNGQNGSQNLTSTGRTTLPAWAARLYNRSSTLSAGEQGPAVSTQYPLGRYMEDNDYLGDLGKTQDVDFDLDVFNGRFCVTPEFPDGTYAYFISLNADGTPAFPYHIGRAFYGSPAGNSVNSITETVTTNFVGGANSPARLLPPNASYNGEVTLTWSSVEGGTYVIESSSDLTSWAQLGNASMARGVSTATTVSTARNPEQFYRLNRTALASFDSVTSAKAGGQTTSTAGNIQAASTSTDPGQTTGTNQPPPANGTPLGPPR